MTDPARLTIVGAGPAGLTAAITAAEAGAPVTLIDSAPQPGGQYYKQPPPQFRPPEDSAGDGQVLFRRLEAANVRLLSNTLVWGAFPAEDNAGYLLTLHGPDAPQRLHTNALILAAGAYDRPMPLPGWTLPGVMTAGAAQTLLKQQRLLPGRKIVLSGSGPLQLALAAQLVKAGANVVAVLESSPKAGWPMLRHAFKVYGQWARLREGWEYWYTLRQARLDYRFGWTAIAAQGDTEVEQVTIAQVDNAWTPRPETARTIEADTLVLGYGFIPATQLSRLLGCDHDFHSRQGGTVPRRDGTMQTSCPGVFAIGDGASIGGAGLAQAEGYVAGLTAARQLGYISAEEAARRIAQHRGVLAREQRFAEMLGALFTPDAGLYTLPTADTVICRCEEVQFADIRAAIEGGARSVNEVKGLTRCGMGNCQGRICGDVVARLIAAADDSDNEYAHKIEAAGVFTVRPPLHPLPLSVLAAAAPPVE